MIKLFNFNSWSALDRTTVQKSNIFLSQFALLAIVGAGISAIHDAIYESIYTVAIDLVIVGIFIFTYLLNEKGHHLKSKLIFVFVSPTSMFLYASLLPKENGVYFIFFPIIMIIFLLFDKKDKLYQLMAMFYTLVLLFLLELTDYQPFGIEPILTDEASSTSYLINLIISLFVIIFSLFSIENLNHQIETKRREAILNLNEINQELKETNEELDQFVYSASHDLKAPLLSVLGLINVAKFDIKEETALLYFDKIEKRVHKLNSFIKEVLSISKNARTEVTKEKVNLESLIQEVIEQNSYIEGMNNIDFKINITLQNDLILDKYRLDIILNNIISNAIKYQKPTNQNKQLHIAASINNNILNISVEDNGVGISQEAIPHVYEMFYRGHESSEGSGLGLYIVQSALRKLNGQIIIQSKLNVGTKVELSIPYI